MRIRVKVFVLGFVLVCLVAVSGYAQQKSDTNDTSLGDIARQLKAQKAKEPKPAKVFTNDNLAAPKDARPNRRHLAGKELRRRRSGRTEGARARSR